MKLFDPAKIDPTAERSRAVLRLPGFPKWRVRLCYILFHYYAYKGRWSCVRITTHIIRDFLSAYPTLLGISRRLMSRIGFLRMLRNSLRSKRAGGLA